MRKVLNEKKPARRRRGWDEGSGEACQPRSRKAWPQPRHSQGVPSPAGNRCSTTRWPAAAPAIPPEVPAMTAAATRPSGNAVAAISLPGA